MAGLLSAYEHRGKTTDEAAAADLNLDPNVTWRATMPFIPRVKYADGTEDWGIPQSLIDLYKAVIAPGHAARGGKVSYEDALNVVSTVGAGGLLAKRPAGSLGAFGDPGNIRGKHASPHKFNKFDLSRIGTGEGAQAYGHGGYISTSDGVHDEYMRSLSPRREISVGGEVVYDGVNFGDISNAEKTLAAEISDRATRLGLPIDETTIGNMLADKEAVLQKAAQSGDFDTFKEIQDQITALKRWRENGINVGSLKTHAYEVELDAKPHEMLDWDKPLEGQEAWQKIRKHWDDTLGDPDIIAERLGLSDSSKGYELYHKLQGAMNGEAGAQSAASKSAREAGIKGIRYLDGNSRGAGEGTYNYVFFDDKDALIHSRDGEPIKGLLSEGGAAFRDVSDETIERLKSYWSSRVWPSPEDARKQIADRIERDNSNLAFGQPTNPAAVERLEFVKSGKGYKISQRRTTKRAPITVAERADSAPPVDWTARDHMHNGTPGSVMKVYGRGVGEVRSGYIPADQVPKPKLAGGKTAYSWDEIDKGGPYPAPTVRLNKNGTVSILDGNHRIHRWLEEGYEHIPAYIIDERKARQRNNKLLKGLLAD